MLPTLSAGIYEHYKGHRYQVLGYAHDANREGKAVVVYMPLQLDGAHYGPRLAVRNATPDDGFDAFWDDVCAEQNEKLGIVCGMSTSDWRRAGRSSSGCYYHPGGATMPRFKYLGPEYLG